MRKQRYFLGHYMTHITTVPDNFSHQRMHNDIGVVMTKNMRTCLKGSQLWWDKDDVNLFGVELISGRMALKYKQTGLLVVHQTMWYVGRCKWGCRWRLDWRNDLGQVRASLYREDCIMKHNRILLCWNWIGRGEWRLSRRIVLVRGMLIVFTFFRYQFSIQKLW